MPDANSAANTDAVTIRPRPTDGAAGDRRDDSACATSSTASPISGSAASATGDSGSHGIGRHRSRRRDTISMVTTSDVADAAMRAAANSHRRAARASAVTLTRLDDHETRFYPRAGSTSGSSSGIATSASRPAALAFLRRGRMS